MKEHTLSGLIEEDGTSNRQKGGEFKVILIVQVNSQKCKRYFFYFKNLPRSHLITMEALPLFSILSAIGNPTVDYFRY